LFFFLIKRTKNEVTSAMLLCRTCHCPAKPVSTTGCLYFALSVIAAELLYQAKYKRPLPLRTGRYVLIHFRPKLGGDEEESLSQTLTWREGFKR